MKIKFIINPKFIAILLIARCEFNEKLLSIINDLKEDHLKEYEEIMSLSRYDYINNLKNEFLKIFMATDYFKEYLKETEVYCNNIEEYWKSKEEYVNNFLKNILRISIDREIKVYISHPFTCIGTSRGNDVIYWGHRIGQEDANYNIVYLVHEALHNILPYKEGMTYEQMENQHAIIELISDYELYSILSNESKIKEGHSLLEKSKLEVYPLWLDYLGLTKEEKMDRMKFDNLKNLRVFDNNLNNLNIYEFIDFVNSYTFDSKESIINKIK